MREEALKAAGSYTDLKLEMEHYRRALNEIRRRQGLVCEHYELCQHRSCRSSYTSWAIADAALRHSPGMSFQETPEILECEK